MKRLLVSTAITLALTPLSSQALSFGDARIAGMGGAAIASGDFTNAKHNPALLTQFQENDDFYFQFGLGAQARDYEDVVDLAEDTQDDLDEFDALLGSFDLSQESEARALNTKINSQLQELGEYNPQLEFGTVLSFLVPSKSIAVGLTVNTEIMLGGKVNYVDSDGDLLDQAVDDAVANGGFEFDQDEIQSNIDLDAVAVTDIALHFAREFNTPHLGTFGLGISPKMQRIDTLRYNAKVANFDEDESGDGGENNAIDNEENRTDKKGFNLDIGMHGQQGHWRYGLVARNLFAQTIEDKNGDELKLKPTVTLGNAYQYKLVTAALDLDLITNKSFEGIRLPSQYARVGLAIDLWGHAQLRAGYRHDLKGNYDDLISAGVGFSPGDVFSLDLTAMVGEDDEMGGVVQFGLKF